MIFSSLRKKLQAYGEALALLTIFIITFVAYLLPALRIVPRHDELDYLARAEKLLEGEIALSPQRGYFFSVVLAVAFFVFGPKLVVAQTTSVLISALVVVPTYLFTKELFREKTYDRQLGMMTVMMVSWVLFRYAVEIRNDTLFILVFMFSCYLGVKGTREPRYLKFAGLFMGLAYFTRDPGILLLPALVIYFMLNSNQSVKFGLTARLRLLFDRNLLAMFAVFLLTIIPKFALRWYAFGHPFYVQNTYNYFWMDDYNEKYYYILTNTQASMLTYLRTHTIQQMIVRWLDGAHEIIGQLHSRLILPLLGARLSSFLSYFSLVGLIRFAKKKYLMLHLNLGIWFVMFSWLFGIRTTTRWITPMFPLLAVAEMGIIFELAILMGRLMDRIIRSPLPISMPKFILSAPSFLLTAYKRTRNILRSLTTWEKLIPSILICLLFASFAADMRVRAKKGYAKMEPDESYYTLRKMADWIIINTPEDALFMSQQEDIIEYYAHRRAMFIPPSDIKFILQTIDDKGVNYLVIDTDSLHSRSALKPIFEGEFLPQGFVLVYKNNDELKIHIYSTGQ